MPKCSSSTGPVTAGRAAARAQENQREQAALIAGLMDRLGIGQAIIVGHSFGGSITAAFALDHPDKTLGLVFLSPLPIPGRAAGRPGTII